jgi:hypothetical protein
MELSRFYRVAEASAHGRFQPFHNEHLEYVLAAQSLCDFLWIGITKYDVTSTDLNPLGAVRERPENNPLTFFERAHVIRESLIDAGVPGVHSASFRFPSKLPSGCTASWRPPSFAARLYARSGIEIKLTCSKPMGTTFASCGSDLRKR